MMAVLEHSLFQLEARHPKLARSALIDWHERVYGLTYKAVNRSQADESLNPILMNIVSEYARIRTAKPGYGTYGDRFSHLYLATYKVLVKMIGQKTSGPGTSWPLIGMYLANGHLIERGLTLVLEVPFNEEILEPVTVTKPDLTQNTLIKVKLDNEQHVICKEKDPKVIKELKTVISQYKPLHSKFFNTRGTYKTNSAKEPPNKKA